MSGLLVLVALLWREPMNAKQGHLDYPAGLAEHSGNDFNQQSANSARDYLHSTAQRLWMDVLIAAFDGLEERLRDIEEDNAKDAPGKSKLHYIALQDEMTNAAQDLLSNHVAGAMPPFETFRRRLVKSAWIHLYPQVAATANTVIGLNDHGMSSNDANERLSSTLDPLHVIFMPLIYVYPPPAEVVADAHIILYFLHLGDPKLQLYHMTMATRLRPMHSRQWMLLGTTHIEGADWSAALEATRKSVEYATSEYERWATQMQLGRCLANLFAHRHEAHAVLDPLVHAAFHDASLRASFSAHEAVVLVGVAKAGGGHDLQDAVIANFMLVVLASEASNVEEAKSYYEAAISRYEALPSDFHELGHGNVMKFWKGDADALMQPYSNAQNHVSMSTSETPSLLLRPWLATAFTVANALAFLYCSHRHLAATDEHDRRATRTMQKKARAAAAKDAQAAQAQLIREQLAKEKAQAALAQAEAMKAQADARQAVLVVASMEASRMETTAREQQFMREAIDTVRREAADASCCDVCFDEPKSHLLFPCGHYCICKSCLERLTERARAASTQPACPVCREAFQGVQRVYDTGR